MDARRCVLPGGCECRLESFEMPDAPPAGGYLMEIQASLISPGTELLSYRRPANGARPYAAGYTATGWITAADDGADAALVGRPVYLFPEDDRQAECHASHRTVRADALVLPLPEGLAPQEAGIDAAVDPEEGDPVETVRKLTGGMGAQLTVNATGRTATFPMSIAATADGGEVSTLGGARQNDETRAYDLLRHVHNRHVTLRGGWEMLLPRRRASGGAGSSTEENLGLALRWLCEGRIDLGPIWTHTVAPEGMADAYAALERMDTGYLGVVVRWEGQGMGGLGDEETR